MYDNRKWVIIDKDEVSSVDFSQVVEYSADFLRYSLDGNKTFVKDDGDQPSFLSGKPELNHSEILEELKKDTWDAGYP